MRRETTLADTHHVAERMIYTLNVTTKVAASYLLHLATLQQRAIGHDPWVQFLSGTRNVLTHSEKTLNTTVQSLSTHDMKMSLGTKVTRKEMAGAIFQSFASKQFTQVVALVDTGKNALRQMT